MKLMAFGSVLSGLSLFWLFDDFDGATPPQIDIGRVGEILVIAGLVMFMLCRGRSAKPEATAPQVDLDRRATRAGKFMIGVADQ